MKATMIKIQGKNIKAAMAASENSIVSSFI